jgi:hypothetical protein
VFGNEMNYHFTKELDETTMTKEREAQLDRGNHKSATNDIQTVAALLLLQKDVTHGFSLAFPSAMVTKLHSSMVQPCGLATRFGLEADGSRKEKKRLTHDLSCSLTGEKISVNERVDMSRYPEMFYGWCLLRVVHFIVCLCHDLVTFDYSDAYRPTRIDVSPTAGRRRFN